MADERDWRELLTEYQYAITLFERASRTLTRALLMSGAPRDDIEALVEAEAKAREATASARMRLVDLWRATADGQLSDWMKPLSPEVLEIAQQFSDLDEENGELIARLIQLVAAAPRSVHDEAGQRLMAPPQPTTQAELRGRVEAVIAYIEGRALEP